MGNLDRHYNPQNLPEKTPMTAIPKGIYIAQAEKAELKTTKSGDGVFVEIMWRVQGPSYEGACVFDRMNIDNRSERAKQIGLAQMGQLQKAVGALFSDTSDIVGRVCQISVAVEADKSGQYEDKNTIRDYLALAPGQHPAMPYQQAPINRPAPPQQPAAQQPAPAAARAPWNRG